MSVQSRASARLSGSVFSKWRMSAASSWGSCCTVGAAKSRKALEKYKDRYIVEDRITHSSSTVDVRSMGSLKPKSASDIA